MSQVFGQLIDAQVLFDLPAILGARFPLFRGAPIADGFGRAVGRLVNLQGRRAIVRCWVTCELGFAGGI